MAQKHYTPPLSRFIVCALFHEAKARGIPMTRLANDLVENGLKEAPGWKQAHAQQEAMRMAQQSQDVRAYMAMLLEEINSRTDFDLRLQPSHDHGRQKTRIRVVRRTMDFDRVVRELQLLGLARNKLLDSGRVKTVLEALLT